MCVSLLGSHIPDSSGAVLGGTLGSARRGAGGPLKGRGHAAGSCHNFNSLGGLGQGSASSHCSMRALVYVITKGPFYPLMPVRTLPLMCLTSLPLAAAEATGPSFICPS